MRDLPQQAHADLGLVDNDCTEDMRKAPAATEALQTRSPHQPIKSKEIDRDFTG
jgi:hypothetical protein